MRNKGYVTVREASEILGIATESLYGKGNTKYARFRHGTKGKRKTMFDIDSFMKAEDLKFEMVEKVKLFVEYLKEIEGMAYAEIAKISGIQANVIAKHSFGHKPAYNILRHFAYQRPFHIKRFDSFYSFTESPIRNVKILK